MTLAYKSAFAIVGATLLFSAPLPQPLGPNSAKAQNASQCGFIQNEDRRSLCRARAGKNVGQCGFIKDNDLRAMCRAEVGNNRGQCGFIQNADMRNECRASVG